MSDPESTSRPNVEWRLAGTTTVKDPHSGFSSSACVPFSTNTGYVFASTTSPSSFGTTQHMNIVALGFSDRQDWHNAWAQMAELQSQQIEVSNTFVEAIRTCCFPMSLGKNCQNCVLQKWLKHTKTKKGMTHEMWMGWILKPTETHKNNAANCDTLRGSTSID